MLEKVPLSLARVERYDQTEEALFVQFMIHSGIIKAPRRQSAHFWTPGPHRASPAGSSYFGRTEEEIAAVVEVSPGGRYLPPRRLRCKGQRSTWPSLTFSALPSILTPDTSASGEVFGVATFRSPKRVDLSACPKSGGLTNSPSLSGGRRRMCTTMGSTAITTGQDSYSQTKRASPSHSLITVLIQKAAEALGEPDGSLGTHSLRSGHETCLRPGPGTKRASDLRTPLFSVE